MWNAFACKDHKSTENGQYRQCHIFRLERSLLPFTYCSSECVLCTCSDCKLLTSLSWCCQALSYVNNIYFQNDYRLVYYQNRWVHQQCWRSRSIFLSPFLIHRKRGRKKKIKTEPTRKRCKNQPYFLQIDENELRIPKPMACRATSILT